MRDSEVFKATRDIGGSGIDGVVGTFAAIDRPRGEHVTELVDFADGVEQRGDELFLRVFLDGLGVRRQGELDAANEIEDFAYPRRLRLGVTTQRGAEAPLAHAGTLGEVEEPGQLRWGNVSRHPRQRRATGSAQNVARSTQA